MARAAKKVSGKAQKGRAAVGRGAGKSARARGGATQSGRREPEADDAQSWFGALDTLARSPLGREILADVLEAAAATVRNRPQAITNAIDAGFETAAKAAGTTAEAVQEAASALADMASRLIPGPVAAGNESSRKRAEGGRGAAKKRRR